MEKTEKENSATLAEAAAIQILTEGRIRYETMYEIYRLGEDEIKQCLVECSGIVDKLNIIIEEADNIAINNRLPATRL